MAFEDKTRLPRPLQLPWAGEYVDCSPPMLPFEHPDFQVWLEKVSEREGRVNQFVAWLLVDAKRAGARRQTFDPLEGPAGDLRESAAQILERAPQDLFADQGFMNEYYAIIQDPSMQYRVAKLAEYIKQGPLLGEYCTLPASNPDPASESKNPSIE